MREPIMCKIAGDDEYYHLTTSAGATHYCRPDDPPDVLKRMSEDMHTYCDKPVSALPHEWIAEDWPPSCKFRVDFTWGKLKPCPVCEKNREADERKAWGY